MKRLAFSILAVSGCLVLAFLGLLAYVYFNERTIDQTLATNLMISNEWTEITPDPPLTVRRQIQEINLRIDGFQHDPSASLPGQIKLPDGTIINPEIEVYDEFGNKFELHHSGFVTKFYEDVVFKPESDSTRFTTYPDDRRYTKIRIRSGVPFECARIYWRNKYLK